MKILLIQPPHYDGEKTRIPDCFPIGLGYIASVLVKNKHNVDIFDIWAHQYTNDEVNEKLKELSNYEIFGITALSTQYAYVQWLTGLLKERYPASRIILGGPLATTNSDLVLGKTDVDICVIGEGEVTIIDVLENIDQLNKVKGIYYKTKDKLIIKNLSREPIKDIDLIEMPLYDTFSMDIYLKNTRVSHTDSYGAINVIAGRGCPFRCNFCSKSTEGTRVRNIYSILEEIKFLLNRYKINQVVFLDELLIRNKKFAYELCEEIQPLNLKWSCQGRVNVVDLKLLKTMKKAGCQAIGYGIESGSQRILDAMNKNCTVKINEEAINRTFEAGMIPIIQMMYGYPGEDEDSLFETREFFRKVKCYMPELSITTPFPGTNLYDEAVKKGLIVDEELYLLKLGGGYNHGREKPFFVNMTNWTDEEFIKKKRELEELVRKDYDDYWKNNPVKNILRNIRTIGYRETIEKIMKKLFKH